MPTNITYKGSILTTVNNNQAKILKTSGKYLEDDITVSSALNLQGKTTSITPNTSTQTTTISPDSGYEGLSGVTITVNPIPSQYIIPAGTITITSNGTHDVSQYADASVNVLPYTATLTGDAGGDHSYVRHNNRQYTSGTFKFTGGDELYICSEGLRGGGNIYINNRLISSSLSRAEYTYTLPNNDVEISFTRGQTSYVYITVPEITITQNGQHDVGSYAIANVNVDAPTPTPSLQNKTVIPTEASQSIAADTGYTGLGTVTVNGITNTYVGSSVPRCDSDDISTTYDSTTNRIKTSVSTGYYSGNNLTQRPDIILPTQSKTTIIPSETDQTAVDQYKWTTGTVTVAAITSTYVGSSITRPGLSGISNSITNGYYKISVSPGYYPGTANKSLGLENPTIIPSETQQVKRPTSNNYYIESVTVAAITSTYVGSSVPAGSLTVSGPTVTASAGYYANTVTETIARGITQNIVISAFTPGITINNSGLISTTGGGTKSKQEPPVIGTGAGYVDSTDRIEASIRITNATYQLPTLPAQLFIPSSSTQTVASTGKYMTGDITVEPIPSQYIVPSGTLTITSLDTTTTFDATSYASIAVNLKDADVTAY